MLVRVLPALWFRLELVVVEIGGVLEYRRQTACDT
jgi:hypothetical protein